MGQEMNEPLPSVLNQLDVSNVYIYVGDAVRWDVFREISDLQGTTIKTISSSIHSPTSFASIISGLSPPQHGVREFSDQLSGDLETLLNISEIECGFSNTINTLFNTKPETESIIHKTLNIEDIDASSIEDINSPFLLVERGPGGHAPYGHEYQGNAHDYFVDRGAVDSKIFHQEYRESVGGDIRFFQSQVEKLRKRGLLDDTLVIYTSDHGELLGEDGCIGHNNPIHEKLVYTPTVFLHPEIPFVTRDGGVFRHIDIVPTISSLLEIESLKKSTRKGRDLTEEELAEYGLCFYDSGFRSMLSGFVDLRLTYESVWDKDGGEVFATSNIGNRLLVLLGILLYSPRRSFMRQHMYENVSLFSMGEISFGSPSFTKDEAKDILEGIDRDIVTSGSRTTVDEDQLRNLGYL